MSNFKDENDLEIKMLEEKLLGWVKDVDDDDRLSVVMLALTDFLKTMNVEPMQVAREIIRQDLKKSKVGYVGVD